MRSLRSSLVLLFSAAVSLPAMAAGSAGSAGVHSVPVVPVAVDRGIPALPRLSELLPASLGPGWASAGFASAVGTGPVFALAPRGASSLGNSSDSALRVEFLAFLPAAPASASAPSSGSVPVPGPSLRGFAEACADMRSLEGLEYWSASRKRMRVLYSEAAILPDSSAARGSDTPLLRGDPPWELVIRLKDLTFGSNRYSLRIWESGGSMEVLLTNLDTVRYGFLPMAQPGGMTTRVFASVCEEGLLIHYAALAEAPALLARRVFESMGNKSLAVMKWFASRAAAAGIAGAGRLPLRMEDMD